MTSRPDVIAARPVQVPARPFYALGVLLDAEDFFAEQSHQRGRLARAFKYLFGSGTLAGLRVVWRPASAQLAVEPGLALDPLGRLVQVSRPVAIRLRGGDGPDDSWFEMQLPEDLSAAVIAGAPAVIVADVFLRLSVCERGLTPAFATGPFDAIDAAQPTRLRDGYELALVIRREGASGPLPAPDDQAILATRPADRAAALQWSRERILGAWRDRSQDWTGGDEDPLSARPRRLNEHVVREREVPVSFPVRRVLASGQVVIVRSDPTEVGRDPTSILLARVRIPVDATVSPPRDLGLVPSIDNLVRRFVHGTGAFVRPDTGASP